MKKKKLNRIEKSEETKNPFSDFFTLFSFLQLTTNLVK